jgi:hypothetical protein
VDDTNRWPTIESIPVPADWKIVDKSTNGIKQCIIWQRQTMQPTRNETKG